MTGWAPDAVRALRHDPATLRDVGHNFVPHFFAEGMWVIFCGQGAVKVEEKHLRAAAGRRAGSAAAAQHAARG